jgi:hypothetical protein
MFFGSLVFTIFLLGFAYTTWTVANQDKSGLKVTGQTLAVLIAIFALFVLLYHGIYGGLTGRGQHMMMREEMMEKHDMMNRMNMPSGNMQDIMRNHHKMMKQMKQKM